MQIWYSQPVRPSEFIDTDSEDFFGGVRAEKTGREKKRHCFFQLRRDKWSNNNNNGNDDNCSLVWMFVKCRSGLRSAF